MERFADIKKAELDKEIEAFLEDVRKRDPDQPEFLQAVEEVVNTLRPLFEQEPRYLGVLRSIVEPEQMHTFRVAWLDDNGRQQVNRGYRVQFSSAIGPYKGGLRFHPTVNLSIIKFLGFEQIFKNSLTGLPLGGGKGGSDFDPKGKSEAEVMRFCQAFMLGLAEHIGPNRDVPAGDIGVAGREIGYMFGQYKRLKHQFEGTLTGKDVRWGGSNLRPEATGYGVVYFLSHFLKSKDQELKGKRVNVSGSGNVAQYCVQKLLELGATVTAMSDSSGYVKVKDGFTKELLDELLKIKQKERKRISELADRYPDQVEFVEGKKVWEHPCDIAIPAATQNEIELEDAKQLVENKVSVVVEGANMPTTPDAVKHFQENDVAFGPAKAVNAGGVAVSGLEMSQNSMRESWSSEEVDKRLQGIMKDIFTTISETAEKYGQKGNLIAGANIAGFLKVADSVVQQGSV